MEYTKVKKLPGLLLFIDFEKAFDSLEWDFLEKCLEKFNFGPEFRRWVHIFYNDAQSCVINNGLCSHYFHIKRGVRQGDPLSPYLFVTAVEILAIAVRNQENIKGITIGGLPTIQPLSYQTWIQREPCLDYLNVLRKHLDLNLI